MEEIEKKGQQLMDILVAETFARHCDLDEKEYLKAIGFENTDKTEDEAIRIAKFNILIEMTKELLKARDLFNMTTELFKTIVNDESLEDKNEEEKGE